MQRLLLVANPAASSFTGATHREVIAILSERFDVEAVWPNGPAHAKALAASWDADVVVAMGGDGVVHHVVNGLVGGSAALGIIPSGTTNVLARILGVPQKPRKAADLIAESTPVPIPLAHLAIEATSGARTEYATFAAGIGYDAEVVTIAEKRPHSKLHFGGIHYAKAAAFQLWRRRHRYPNLRVQCGDRKVDASAVLVQVHWPYTYFGMMPLRLTPEPVSGLAAAVIERANVRRGAEIFARLAVNKPLQSAPGVQVWSSFDKLIIEAEPVAPLQADGELLGDVASLEVSVRSHALEVFAARVPH